MTQPLSIRWETSRKPKPGEDGRRTELKQREHDTISSDEDVAVKAEVPLTVFSPIQGIALVVNFRVANLV